MSKDVDMGALQLFDVDFDSASDAAYVRAGYIFREIPLTGLPRPLFHGYRGFLDRIERMEIVRRRASGIYLLSPFPSEVFHRLDSGSVGSAFPHGPSTAPGSSNKKRSDFLFFV